MKGELSSIGTIEFFTAVASRIILVVWISIKLSGGKNTATIAQVLILCVISIGFIPVFTSQIHETPTEPFLPWFLWTLTSLTQAIVVILDWEGKWIDIASH